MARRPDGGGAGAAGIVSILPGRCSEVTVNMADSNPFAGPETEVLGLEPGETTPVRIILAAQLRLRRFRQSQSLGTGLPAGSEVRRIVAARDALLERAVGVISRRSRDVSGG